MEQTYTLGEARSRLAEQECTLHGHDWDVVSTMGGVPRRIVCARCGRRHDVVTSASSSAEADEPISLYDYCNLSAPTARDGGAVCQRRAGHYGPGLLCTANREQAEARDRHDALGDD